MTAGKIFEGAFIERQISMNHIIMGDQRSAVSADVSTSPSTKKVSIMAVVVLFLTLCGFIYGLLWIRAFFYVTQDAKVKAMTTAATSMVETVGQECHSWKRETGISEI